MAPVFLTAGESKDLDFSQAAMKAAGNEALNLELDPFVQHDSACY
jgi:hypothetical protein